MIKSNLILQSCYEECFGQVINLLDASAAEAGYEELVDTWVQAFFDREDEEIIWDLRQNSAERPEKYTVLF